MTEKVKLVGKQVPSLALPSTSGSVVNPANLSGTTVIVIYPFTGRPGFPNPPGWDDIPGAHGSTPQLLAFSKSYDDFTTLDVKIFGLSSMSLEWQTGFADRNTLPFAMLSDENRNFASAMNLTTFKAGQVDYLMRRTLIITDGVVSHDFFPVSVPEENAADVLRLLRS